MPLISRIKDLFIDFLFPRSQKILELEALSINDLINILPPAQDLKDRYTIALFDYSNQTVKELIWEFKYNGNIRIADKLGKILSSHITNSWKIDKPILVPIPISDKRRFERGWNQSELLVKGIMKQDNERMFRYLPRQLIKIHHTDSQTTTASRKERRENLINSMKVSDASRVAGECIIVVDDVTTTGSTFIEARRALYTAGAKKVICIAVAH